MSSCIAEFSGVFSPSAELFTPDTDFWSAASQLLSQLGNEDVLTSCLASGVVPDSAAVNEQKLHLQKTWGEKVHLKVRHDLIDNAPVRDRVRLQRQGELHAGDWLNVTPNENLGFRFGSAEYRLLLLFHLGMPVFPSEAVGSPCDDCGEAQDIFGDHIVACRLSGLWERHNLLRDTVALIATTAGFRATTEEPVAGRRRPADVLVHDFSPGSNVAADLTVVHALNHSQQWDGPP